MNESIKYNHPLRKCVDTILKKVICHILIFFLLKYKFVDCNIIIKASEKCENSL